jgi:hypothetical protein
MEYTIVIYGKDNQGGYSHEIINQVFSDNIPILNRRKAIKTMQEAINSLKNPDTWQLLEQVLPGELFRGNVEEAKEKALKEYKYHVYTKDPEDPSFPIAIESSVTNEEILEENRMYECSLYLKYGFNTGGDPVEVYVSKHDVYLPFLKDNIDNSIGLRQLLDS